MEPQALLPSESYGTGASFALNLSPGTSSSQATLPALYLAMDARRPPVLPVANTQSIDRVIARLESNPKMAALLAQARARVAEQLPLSPLSQLRMRQGLSQRAVAERCGTSQPHIAKIEQGAHDPVTATVARLAAALQCTDAEALAAVIATRAWAAAK